MSAIRVIHGIGDLARDLSAIPPKNVAGLVRIVDANQRAAEKYMQGLAKARSGSHGRDYWKRIGSDKLSPMSAEIGPHGDVRGNAIGAGWRNGPINTDTERTADVIGPRFHRYVSNHAAGLFR